MALTHSEVKIGDFGLCILGLCYTIAPFLWVYPTISLIQACPGRPGWDLGGLSKALLDLFGTSHFIQFVLQRGFRDSIFFFTRNPGSK